MQQQLNVSLRPPPQQHIGRPATCLHQRHKRPHKGPTQRQAAAHRPGVPPQALPGWAQQLLGGVGQQAEQRRATPPEAQELLELLTSAGQDGAPKLGASRQRRADALVTQLLAYADLPFNEQLLGGGPWRVMYTRGTPQLWKATFSAGRLVNASNAASQDFDPAAGRAVVNRAEYLGDRLWVTASGSYAPVDDTAVLPKRIQANITSGQLHAFGLDIPLPIRGTGFFEVVYLDASLRVFRSGGAVAAQVNEAYLQRQGLL